jgi:glycosyltransferase involved in cell wall biosynthesis
LALNEPASFPHANYRSRRTVVPSRHPVGEALVTIFVGLYNADAYWDGLVSLIEAQTGRGYRWLLVDNASSDDTWSSANAWAESSELDVTLVRSAFNLGSTGSVFVHFDLVSTEWAAFMHQDDVYLPEHFEVIETTARSASPGAVCIFSDMGRVSHDGKVLGPYPPPAWMLPDLEPATLLLGLIRNHCIPWPTLAVRTAQFRAMETSWHSTAAPDTEVTLRLIAHGSFVHVAQETMRYRDNAKSESRSIDNRERRFGETMSLLRTFESPEFADIALRLRREDRSAFVVGLEHSVHSRMGMTEHAQIVISAAFERLDKLWDNAEPTVLSKLAGIYGSRGASATASLLDRMSIAAGGAFLPASVDSSIPTAPEQDPDRLRSSPAIQMFRAYERFGYLLPYRLRRSLAHLIISTATRNNPLSAWRFQWR